jgi:endonuclease/exonuclease/phosphatase family metal-dependent hydrolase
VTPLLRLASYNLLHGISIRSGLVELGQAAEAIAALRADVVALQEADRGLARSGGIDQVAELARHTGLHAVFVPALLGDPDGRWTAARGEDSCGPGYGVGLLSRTPLHAPERIPLPGGGERPRRPARRRATPGNPGWDYEPRVALAATVPVSGIGVRVATAHLSYLPWRGLAQLRVAASAVAAFAGPAALIGDLNLPAWPVRLAVRDGWSQARSAPTYPAWRPRVALDQLLVRGGLEVRDVVVAPPATSDHRPLVVTVAVTTAPSRA